MSDPLDTTPCSRPSANSTNGTLASLRGWTGVNTRAVLWRAHAVASMSNAGPPVTRSSYVLPHACDKTTNRLLTVRFGWQGGAARGRPEGRCGVRSPRGAGLVAGSSRGAVWRAVTPRGGGGPPSGAGLWRGGP